MLGDDPPGGPAAAARTALRSRTARRLFLACAGTAAALLAGVVGSVATAPPASASDEAGFKALKAEFDKAAKNHDDIGNRARRRLILQAFDYRDQKSCKKLLRDAFGDESLPDNRVAVMQVLPACGDPKEIDFCLSALKKEKSPGPIIALAEGLGFTDPASTTVIAQHVALLLAKNKGDVQRSLIEGVGVLGDPAAFAALNALGEKLPPAEAFERLVAMGACGKGLAVPGLAKAAKISDPTLRLAAALGLARTGVPEAAPLLVELISDLDWRVAVAAIEAVGAMKHEPAKDALIATLSSSSIRTREAARAALKEITGKDCGWDADAWKTLTPGTLPPAGPSFFGISVASSRVVVIVDLSRSMSWSGRLDRARAEVKALVAALGEDTQFDIIEAGRGPKAVLGGLASGPSAKSKATEAVEKLATASGFDTREAVQFVLRTMPDADTILIATDSYPYGEGSEDTPLSVMQEIRKENRMRRVRIDVAFVAPGGRYAESETDADEYDDRKFLLKLFAESNGGRFVAVE